MSASAELQKVIFDALLDDGAVDDLIGNRIYDRMPSDGDYPCVTFGPSDALPADAECITSWDEFVQIDVWSREQGRLKPCKDIVHAVRQALHETDLSLPNPYALHEMRVSRVTVRLDPDGITAHGVVEVTAMVERV